MRPNDIRKIGYVVIGVAALATLFFSIKVGSLFLFIWQSVPYLLMVYGLARCSDTSSSILFNFGAFFIISSAALYSSYDIIFVHPDPQGGIALFMLPLLQIAAYGILTLVYLAAKNFRLK